MTDDFAYVNARIRGMRSELLSTVMMHELSSLRDLDGIMARLRSTAYGRPLQSALSRHPGIDGIEEGFRDSLGQTFSRLGRYGSGTAGGLVGIAMGRWEVSCLKGLLRGKIRQESPDMILSACVPAGIFDEPSLRLLAALDGVGEILSHLRIWGYSPARALQKAWKAGQGPSDLQKLEFLLDQSFFDDAFSRFEEGGSSADGFPAFLALDIDLTNILTTLRLIAARSGSAESAVFFLKGGRSFSRETSMRIAGKASVTGAVESLGPSPLGRMFLDALPAYHSTGGRISVMERAASRRLLVEAVNFGRREPLGAGLAVGYLWAKVNEVENLRLICRAVHIGMPRQVLEEEITLPPP